MSEINSSVEEARIVRELSSAMVAVRERTPVLALIDAGNDLAAALDCGAAGEQSTEQLVQAWERALFGVARDFDGQFGEGRA
jgi:hypothetical protein